MWGDLIEALLRMGNYRFALLMEKRRKKKKFVLVQLEAARTFTYPAFPQNDDLLTPPQRINDNGPFFESGPHGFLLCLPLNFRKGGFQRSQRVFFILAIQFPAEVFEGFTDPLNRTGQS